MDKRNTLFVFMGLIMFSLFGLLGVYAYGFKKNIKYIDLERNIATSIKSIDYKENLKDKVINEIVVPVEPLDDIDLKVNNEECKAYGVIKKYFFVYTYKGYIKCSNYKTSGFNHKNVNN